MAHVSTRNASVRRPVLAEALERRCLMADVGNTLAAATDLGTIGTSLNKSESVGGGDAADVYKFTLAAINDLSVSVSSGDVYQKIIWDKNNNKIIDSGEALTGQWGGTASQRLPAGSYYVFLEPGVSSSVSYTLGLSRKTTAADPGSTLFTAKDLGTVGTSAINTDWVGNADAADVYKFSIGTISDVNVSLDTGDVYQKIIWDKNNNGLIDSGEALTGQWGGTARQRLSAGTYYVTTEPGNGGVNYTVAIGRTSAGADPGNTLVTATNLGTLSSTISKTDWVGNADAVDVYKFAIASISDVNVSLDTGNVYQKIIWDKNNNGLIDSGEALTGQWGGNAHQRLEAGTYFVTAEPGVGGVDYTLAVSRTSAGADAGGTLAAATDLGTVGGTKQLSDWVGNADAADFYKFTLPAGGNVNLGVDNGNTYIRLIKDANKNGIIDSGDVLHGQWGGSFDTTVTAGTYFASAEPGNGDVFYTMSITTPAVATKPEADVFGNGVGIADGDTTASTADFTDFGSVAKGAAAVSRTFTVKNTGTTALTTSGLTVPAGFTVTEALSASIAAGGSDTFTVKLNTATAGTFSGNISFANNDANENPYNFAVKGVVTGSFAVLSGGVLTLTGTSANDRITGTIAGNVLTLKLNGLAQTFASASAISKIVVNALGGNDSILFGPSVNRPTSLNGGDGDDTIVGGNGVDAINGGAGTDVATQGTGDTLTLIEEILA